MARVLTYLDAPMWKAVRELYLQDKVIEALEEAEKLGGQDSNDLYAEAEVRREGSQWEVRPWLTVEGIDSELGHAKSAVLEIIGNACEGLSRRFGWDHPEATLIALLPQDVEAPWMPGRWGYFMDKVPYDKICLPHHLIHDLPELNKTVLHEFMHDITINVTHGHAPRWLSEALSTYAEGRLDVKTWDAIKQSRVEWLSPQDLDAMVSSDNRDAGLHQSISAAYSEANFVARFLAAQGGDQKLGNLLKEIGDEGFLHNLENQLLSRSRTDAALRKVYHLAEIDLFERVHGWVLSTSVPLQ